MNTKLKDVQMHVLVFSTRPAHVAGRQFLHLLEGRNHPENTDQRQKFKNDSSFFLSKCVSF